MSTFSIFRQPWKAVWFDRQPVTEAGLGQPARQVRVSGSQAPMAPDPALLPTSKEILVASAKLEGVRHPKLGTVIIVNGHHSRAIPCHQVHRVPEAIVQAMPCVGRKVRGGSSAARLTPPRPTLASQPTCGKLQLLLARLGDGDIDLPLAQHHLEGAQAVGKARVEQETDGVPGAEAKADSQAVPPRDPRHLHVVVDASEGDGAGQLVLAVVAHFALGMTTGGGEEGNVPPWKGGPLTPTVPASIMPN